MLVEMIDRLQRNLGPAFRAPFGRPWINRGVADAISSLGIKSSNEAELSAVWATSFERGALDAVRFAKIILSDPATRGRELEALDLIAEGHGHAAIKTALAKSKPICAAAGQQTIVPFKPRERKHNGV